MPVDIHGKPYRTVAERTELFHEQHKKETKSITTEILINDGNIILMKTTIEVGDSIYQGHAQETYNSSHINKTSALENCETSSIGRALASAGFVGEEFASANEVQNAIKQQKNGVSVRPKTSKPKSFVKNGAIEKTTQEPLDWNEETRSQKLGFSKNKDLTWDTIENKFLNWIIENMENEKIRAKANAEILYRKIKKTTEDLQTSSSLKKNKTKETKQEKYERESQEQFEKELGLDVESNIKSNPSKKEVSQMAINQPSSISEEKQGEEFSNG